MKTKNLLSGLMTLGIVCAMSVNIAHAADNASQTVTAELGTCQSVVDNGGNLTANIDCATGGLDAALTPAFIATTNTAASQDMYCNATAPVSGGGTTPAMGLQGGVMYLALANTDVGFEPTALQVGNTLGAGPSGASNPNAIAFTTTLSANPALGVTITPAASYFDIDIAQQGNTDFISTTSGAARPNTFDFNDTPGDYEATVKLSFGTP